MKRWAWILPAVALAPFWACHDDAGKDDGPDSSPRVRHKGEPRRVRMERILISYAGNPFDIKASRSLDQARALALSVYDRARRREDFVELRNTYSDDRLAGSKQANGPYILLNYDIPMAPTMPDVPRMKRVDMGRRLGDQAFRLRPGEVALVEYHKHDYPAGYEVIRCELRDDRTEEQVAADLKRTK